MICSSIRPDFPDGREQARTQYETAAVLIPQIESQIVEVENALSILLGRIRDR